MELTGAQREYLLRPLSRERVSSRTVQGRSLSYVEAWDIKRTLIRVFGFGGFDAEVTRTEILSCELGEPNDRGKQNWDVSALVTMRLTIHGNGYGGHPTYSESAVGSAHLPDKGEALDMAVKTAASDALKRCAINLGTQFGLGLYNGGALDDVVVGTLEGAPLPADPAAGDPPVTPEEPEGPILDPVVERTDEAYLKWMADLRFQATNPDSATRIIAVDAMRAEAAQFGEGFLDEVTTVGGQEMTYRTLCSNVQTGKFLTGGAQ